MKRPALAALATCVLALVSIDCTNRAGSSQSAAGCEAYLDCLAETDQEMFESELEIYGSNGSCLEGSDQATCDTACEQKLEAINSDVEACNPPEPESDPGPTPMPDESGMVDCADYDSGPTVGPGEPGPTGFPPFGCSPRSSGEGVYKCCSDDPAAPGGALPDYANKNIDGATPLFSGVNNALGTSGLCVNTSDIPTGSGLIETEAANCPIPCNPTWSEEETAIVCGASRVCCQTRELEAPDCVAAEDGGFRPVTGEDIGDQTDWAPAAHATHQDPGGVACSTIAGGDQASDVFLDCIAQLSVADQRGFCMALGPGQQCPAQQESYIDACEAM